MKKALLTSAVIALSLQVSTQAFADNYGEGFSINPGVGYYDFDNALEIKEESYPSLGLEYRFTPNMAVEASYFDGDTVNKRTTIVPAEYDIQQYRLNGNYYFSPEQKLQPYLSAGVGSMKVEQTLKNIKNEDTIGDVGLGARYFFNQYISMRGDLRGIQNFDESFWDTAANIGLNIMFGGRKASQMGDIDLAANSDADNDGILDANDQCANTPAGVAVDAMGCPLDADMDGVADINDDCLGTKADLMVDERGCDIAIEETVSMDLNVNFAFESAQLPPEFYSDVKELATFLKLYEGSKVTIEGHADATGTDAFNLNLSKQRAKAIRDILVKDFNIDGERLDFVGYGEARPVADNATEDGRSRNRRAATVVTATRKPGEKPRSAQEPMQMPKDMPESMMEKAN